jgi:hypothetical protein
VSLRFARDISFSGFGVTSTGATAIRIVSSSATIVECDIGGAPGGGLEITGVSSVDVIATNVHGNAAAGITLSRGSSLLLEQSTVSGNGAGIWANSSEIEVSNGSINDNRSVGLNLHGGTHVRLGGGSSVSGNAAEGLGLSEGSSALVVDSSISHNLGGGIYADNSSSVKVMNADISWNHGQGIDLSAGASLTSRSPGPTVISNNGGYGISTQVSSFTLGPGDVSIFGNGAGIVCSESRGVCSLSDIVDSVNGCGAGCPDKP